jgi:hypothetical protein
MIYNQIFDLTNVLAKVTIHVPLTELVNIPSQMHKVREFLSIEEEPEDPHVVLQTMSNDRKTGGHTPFFITLMVNYLLLHSCMLDSRDSTNVMSLKAMNELGLKTIRPYINSCGIYSREINVCGLIKDVSLVSYPDVSIIMDVVVIYVHDSWGMLLSRKWDTTLGVVSKWIYLMKISLPLKETLLPSIGNLL